MSFPLPLTKMENKSIKSFMGWSIVVAALLLLAVWLYPSQKSHRQDHPHKRPSVTQARIATQHQGSGVYSQRETAASPSRLPLNVKRPPVRSKYFESQEQIRWCLVAKIRLDALRSLPERMQFQAELERRVLDYNKRCNKVCRPWTDPAQARADIEPRREEIAGKYIAKLRKSSVEPAVQPPPQRKATMVEIAEAQKILAELGYDPGSTDGRAGRKTLNAIKAYQRDMRLPQSGDITNVLLDLLRKSQDIDEAEKNIAGLKE